MYAFGIVGIDSTQNKPAPPPPLYTPDPFSAVAPQAVVADQGERRKRRREENIEGFRECWFCLQNPNCDAHLVVSVGKVACGYYILFIFLIIVQEIYLALAKGGVVDEHLLVVPI